MTRQKFETTYNLSLQHWANEEFYAVSGCTLFDTTTICVMLLTASMYLVFIQKCLQDIILYFYFFQYYMNNKGFLAHPLLLNAFRVKVTWQVCPNITLDRTLFYLHILCCFVIVFFNLIIIHLKIRRKIKIWKKTQVSQKRRTSLQYYKTRVALLH